MNKEVVAIFTSPGKGEGMESHSFIRAIAGVGLEGDRYALRKGAYSGVRIPDEDRQVTLISLLGIAKANEKLNSQGINSFGAHETRRNIVLEIEPEELNGLVGKRFLLGEIELEGVDLCEPCRRPAAVLNRSSADGIAFEAAFKGRGGIRARIITSGQLLVGDQIKIDLV